MKLRNLLLGLIAVLTLSTFTACNGGNQTSEEKIIYHEDGVTVIDSVVGKKTKTSHTVDFYYNQPDKGIYKRYYVEDGEKIRVFTCLISGFLYQGFFYDQFGQQPFDFATPIKSDMKLYAYHLGNGQGPAVYPYEEQGEFKITWGRVNGASYKDANGEALPLSANKDEVVKFKLVTATGTNKQFAVSCNGQTITPDSNGVYSVTITKNTRISTSITGTSAVTYTVEGNPDWLKNDGAVIYGWIWGPQEEGCWIEANLEGTSFSFTTDKELTGFLFVRCVRGTSTPSWQTTGDAAGRIYNKTNDFIYVPGRTTYNGASAWVEYNPG